MVDVLSHDVEPVADALGMDPVEVRRRNVIRDDQFPYTTASGSVYDNGSLIESLEKVCAEADYEEMRERRRLAREEGRLLGIRVVTSIEQTAPAVDEGARVNIRYNSAIVRLDPSGSATVQLGTHSHGQGHETTFAQIVADQLTIPVDRIRILDEDTQQTAQGIGIKGVGEGRAIAPYAIMAAAVQDAIRPIGEVFVNELPLTPERVLGFIDRAAGVNGREGSRSG